MEIYHEQQELPIRNVAHDIQIVMLTSERKVGSSHLLYTGLTRAKRLTVVVGPTKAIGIAVKRVWIGSGTQPLPTA
ncbi:MAG: hypothetical protein ACJ788_05775 [Ktedonobacteraceae bacterium]